MCNVDEREWCALCDRVIAPGLYKHWENGKTYHLECFLKHEKNKMERATHAR